MRRRMLGCVLASLALALCFGACKSTESRIERKRDPILDEVARLGERWRQCFVENQTVQFAQIEQELCDKVRSNFQKFIDGISAQDNLTRIWAARSLGFAKDPQALPFLLAALNDPLEEVRANAMFSISFLHDPATPMDKITPLMSDSSDHVRHNTMHAIQKLVEVRDDKGAMSTILRGLEDRFPGVRNEAIIAIMNIRDKSAAKAIIATCLHDEYHRARINAASALGVINAPEAVEPLIEILGDSNMHVRKAAGWSLRTITGMDIGDDLAKWMEWWETNKTQYKKPGEPQDSSKMPAVEVLPQQDPAAAAAAAAAEEERLHRTRCDIAQFHVKTISKAIDKFIAENGRQPATLAELVTKPADISNWPEGGYLTAIPEDPWGNVYIYRPATGEGNKYELLSMGADGVEGGEGRGADIEK